MQRTTLLSSLVLVAAALLGDPPTLFDNQDADPPIVFVGDGERVTMEPTVADLAFLSGTWSGSDGTSDWEAVYSGPEGGQIVAASKELRDGRVVMIDFEHFYEREGTLRLVPFPFGNRSVEFTLTKMDVTERLAVFENPEHDFPKRFTYHRTDENHLAVELVGDMGRGEMSVTIDYERAKREAR